MCRVKIDFFVRICSLKIDQTGNGITLIKSIYQNVFVLSQHFRYEKLYQKTFIEKFIVLVRIIKPACDDARCNVILIDKFVTKCRN